MLAPGTGGPYNGGPHIEVLAGYAGFVDDATIDHVVLGAAARVYLSPRISVGPEITYMRGPNTDRDWYFLGNLTWDIRHPRADRAPRVSPFPDRRRRLLHPRRPVHHGRFRTYEGAFAAGGGTRVQVSDRVYAMGDFRIGWELHSRITGGVGVAM